MGAVSPVLLVQREKEAKNEAKTTVSLYMPVRKWVTSPDITKAADSCERHHAARELHHKAASA